MKNLIIAVAILFALLPVAGLYFSIAYAAIMHSLSRWQDGAMPDVPNNYKEE